MPHQGPHELDHDMQEELREIIQRGLLVAASTDDQAKQKPLLRATCPWLCHHTSGRYLGNCMRKESEQNNLKNDPETIVQQSLPLVILDCLTEPVNTSLMVCTISCAIACAIALSYLEYSMNYRFLSCKAGFDFLRKKS